MDRRTSLPDVLTLFRLAAAPVLVVLAVSGASGLFLGLLVLALLSDAIDGPIARARGQQSMRGASLDSWADFAVYLATPIAVVILRPWLIEREPFLLVSVVVAYAVPLLGGALKYRRLTSYHTTAARIAGVLLSAATILLVGADLTWPARVAVIALLIAAAEELAITCVLHEWRADVPSLRAALRSRAGSKMRVRT